MIKGIGIDLCEIARMERHLSDDRFLSRFFTPQEVAYLRSKNKQACQSLAGLFAAKEALSKALGTGISFDLREAEIAHDENGQPFFRFSGNLAEAASGDRFFLSITHDAGVAAAVCVRETSGSRPSAGE